MKPIYRILLPAVIACCLAFTGCSPEPRSSKAVKTPQQATKVTPLKPDHDRHYLPQGLSLDIPKSWTINSDEYRRGVVNHVKKMVPEDQDVVSTNPFSAKLIQSGAAEALISTRYYPEQDVTQSDIANMPAQMLGEYDAMLHKGLVGTLARGGINIKQWLGTRRHQIGDIVALESEYIRVRSSNPKPFRVRLYRVLNGPKSFTLTTSYHLENKDNLESMMQEIIDSASFNRS